MRRVLVVFALFCAIDQPLMACLNDSATKADEQQFVSGYGDHGPAQARTPVGVQVSTFNPTALLLVVPSLALLAVAVLWLRQERARAGRPTPVPRSDRA